MSEPLTTRYTDGAGRTWTVALTVGDLRPVREATGVEVAGLMKDDWQPLQKLLDEAPEVFGLVLWTLCRAQAAPLGVTEEQFMRSLAGDALEDATVAFVGALANFSGRRTRELVRLRLEKTEAARELAMTRARAALAALTPETILAGSSGPAPGSPASSGSTRRGSRPGNSKKRHRKRGG